MCCSRLRFLCWEFKVEVKWEDQFRTCYLIFPILILSKIITGYLNLSVCFFLSFFNFFLLALFCFLFLFCFVFIFRLSGIEVKEKTGRRDNIIAKDILSARFQASWSQDSICIIVDSYVDG